MLGSSPSEAVISRGQSVIFGNGTIIPFLSHRIIVLPVIVSEGEDPSVDIIFA